MNIENQLPEEHEPIRLVQTIVNQQEVISTAKQLGVRYLVRQAHKQIHRWADKQPRENHVVTTHEIRGGTGFLVGMAYVGGLFGDFALLFEMDITMARSNAIAFMQQLSEQVAYSIFDRATGDCMCAECGCRAKMLQQDLRQ